MARKAHGGPDMYTPKPATVKKTISFTTLEKFLEVELDNGKPLDHQPGQFVEVSVMGVGEAPFCVSSSPTKKSASFDMLVRNVGAVSGAIHKLKEGDKIGIRGPYGRGFDTKFLKGKDILFVCGGMGIAPLRSLINYVCDRRKEFGEVTILYGCKKPSEVLFCDEVNSYWRSVEGVRSLLSADKVPEGEVWQHNVGVITTLIPKAQFNPETTYAVVCGPPIMYKFAIRSLKERNLADDHIIVSLERRMKCGVGKCGHCQINGLYCCQDGPVFKYSEIKDITEAL